jgi:hypothetical protein
MSHSTLKCAICGGPINLGEPVVAYDAGFAHRFKTTCEWEAKNLAEIDRVNAHALGVKV